MNIKLDNGKYEIILNDNPFEFKALRYGEEWRDLSGDKLILALVDEIESLKNKSDKWDRFVKIAEEKSNKGLEKYARVLEELESGGE